MPGAPDLLLPAPRALSAFPFLRGARCSVRKAPPLFCVSARLDPLPALNMPPTGPPPAAAAYRPQTGSPDGSCTFASTSPPGHRFPIPPTPPRPQAWGFHPARDDTCPHHTAPIGHRETGRQGQADHSAPRPGTIPLGRCQCAERPGGSGTKPHGASPAPCGLAAQRALSPVSGGYAKRLAVVMTWKRQRGADPPLSKNVGGRENPRTKVFVGVTRRRYPAVKCGGRGGAAAGEVGGVS